MALSLPIPKENKLKFVVSYFPEKLENGNKIKRLWLNLNYSDTTKDMKSKIKAIVGTKNNILLYYLKTETQLEGELSDDIKVAKLGRQRLVAYECSSDPHHKSIIKVHLLITKEIWGTFGDSTYEPIWEPKLFLLKSDQTWTEIRREIFRYFFPSIKLNTQYREAYHAWYDKEEMIDQIKNICILNWKLNLINEMWSEFYTF